MGYVGVLGGNTANWDNTEPSPASIAASYGAASTFHMPFWYRQHEWAKAINLLKQVNAGTLSVSDYKRTIGWQEVDVGTGATNYPLPNPMMAMGSAGQMTGATNSMFEGATALQSLQYFAYATFFMHPSAYYADILLPRADPCLEGNSINGSQGSGTTFLAEWWFAGKAVPEPGECKPDEWYCTQIANALGISNYNQYYTEGIDSDADLSVWDAMVISRLQASYTTFSATMAKNVGFGPNAPAMTVPSWSDFVAGANIKLADYNTTPWVGLSPASFPLKTSTGKINILIDFLASASYPAADGQAVPCDALPTYGRNYPGVPGYIPQVRGWYDSLTNQYPLVMLSTHSRYRDHSAFFNNIMLRPEVYQHNVWISATDAIARGISDGDTVAVSNDKGTVVLPAYVTARVSPGVVIIRHGGWFKEAAPNVDIGGCPNSLTGEGVYSNGVVNDPTISPVTPAKATTLVQVQDAEYL